MPLSWTLPVMLVSYQVDGAPWRRIGRTRLHPSSVTNQPSDLRRIPSNLGPGLLSVMEMETRHVGFDKNSDLLRPFACPHPPFPFTMLFSVPRQPFSAHGGHEGDRGVPTIQALGPVFQLQDPGKELTRWARDNQGAEGESRSWVSTLPQLTWGHRGSFRKPES